MSITSSWIYVPASAGTELENCAGLSGADFPKRCPDHDRPRAIFPDRFGAVNHQIHYDLLHLRCISFNGRQVRRKVEFQFNGFRDGGPDQGRDLPNEVAEIDYPHRELTLAGVGEHLSRQECGAFGGRCDLAQTESDRLIRSHFRQSQTGVPEDAGEQIVKIVRDAARQ